jgi:fatty-acyl-CoA synthase
VEDAVSKVAGIIPGRVVAFAEDNVSLGTEQVAVVAESTVADDTARKALRMEVIKAGMAIDVTITGVYLVPPRWLIKSSAGKPGRKANRERILADKELELKSK